MLSAHLFLLTWLTILWSGPGLPSLALPPSGTQEFLHQGVGITAELWCRNPARSLPPFPLPVAPSPPLLQPDACLLMPPWILLSFHVLCPANLFSSTPGHRWLRISTCTSQGTVAWLRCLSPPDPAEPQHFPGQQLLLPKDHSGLSPPRWIIPATKLIIL